jgi:L-fucose mutarotase
MLKNINPLLNADILHALASMGHGDELVITDANFPAAAIAAQTVLGKPLHIAVDTITALEAVLSLFPIDTFDPERAPVRGMQIVGQPDAVPEVIMEAAPLLADHGAQTVLIERFAFYAAAKQVYAIIRTVETRPYGNLILRKGVVN